MLNFAWKWWNYALNFLLWWNEIVFVMLWMKWKYFVINVFFFSDEKWSWTELVPHGERQWWRNWASLKGSLKYNIRARPLRSWNWASPNRSWKCNIHACPIRSWTSTRWWNWWWKIKLSLHAMLSFCRLINTIHSYWINKNVEYNSERLKYLLCFFGFCWSDLPPGLPSHRAGSALRH